MSCGMRVALSSAMATVFRLRWFLTVHLLEFALRVMLLCAIFKRPVDRRLLSGPE